MGGTGVLPFMDLFAYLARRLLDEKAPNYSLFPDEKFTEIHKKILNGLLMLSFHQEIDQFD